MITHRWDSALQVAEAHPWGQHTPDMQQSLLGNQSSADPILTPPESTAGCPASRDMSGGHSDPLIPNLSQGLCAAACTWTHQGTFSVCALRCFSFQALKVFLLVTQTRTTSSHEQCVCVAQNPGSPSWQSVKHNPLAQQHPGQVHLDTELGTGGGSRATNRTWFVSPETGILSPLSCHYCDEPHLYLLKQVSTLALQRGYGSHGPNLEPRWGSHLLGLGHSHPTHLLPTRREWAMRAAREPWSAPPPGVQTGQEWHQVRQDIPLTFR